MKYFFFLNYLFFLQENEQNQCNSGVNKMYLSICKKYVILTKYSSDLKPQNDVQYINVNEC